VWALKRRRDAVEAKVGWGQQLRNWNVGRQTVKGKGFAWGFGIHEQRRNPQKMPVQHKRLLTEESSKESRAT